jgi:hypothetical protein
VLVELELVVVEVEELVVVVAAELVVETQAQAEEMRDIVPLQAVTKVGNADEYKDDVNAEQKAIAEDVTVSLIKARAQLSAQLALIPDAPRSPVNKTSVPGRILSVN